MPNKKKNSFVLLLYIAVMLFSALHKHGMEINWLSHPVFSENNGNGSTHHSTVKSSECLIVMFAGNSALTESKYISGDNDKIQLLKTAEYSSNITSKDYNTSPLRGPPSL